MYASITDTNPWAEEEMHNTVSEVGKWEYLVLVFLCQRKTEVNVN